MNSQKRLLLTLKYLWEKTDEEHPATLKGIGEYLQQNGVETTRKTLQADINFLMEFGIDVICNHSTQNQYHIGERVFEVPEVKLLVDAVQSARFITAKKSKTLIKKLSLFVGEPQADILKRHLYVDNRLKAGNESIYFTVDLIHQATAKESTHHCSDYTAGEYAQHTKHYQTGSRLLPSVHQAGRTA